MDEYFKKCISENPFKDNEDKKFEFCRFLSFQNWPQECPIYPIKLAKAGFYYSGNGDEVKCFCCGIVKSDWQADDDPNVIHRLFNPDCPYLDGINDGNVNVPISRTDTDQEESSLIRRLNSVIEERRELIENETESSDIVSEAGNQEDQCQHDERSSESPESNLSRSRSLGTLQDSRVSGLTSNSLHESRSASTIDTHSRGNENLANSAVMLDSSAAAAVNNTDSSINDNKSKSEKKKEKQLKKQKEKKDKKSLKASIKGSLSSKKGSDSNVTPQRGYDIPPPTGESIGPLRFERNRLETFSTWPSNACVPATELAKSGFYYTGSGDRLQCIFCKGVLRNWEEGDRPHIEHRKHFPRCPMVLGMKMGNVPLPLDQVQTNTSAGSIQGLNSGTVIGNSMGNMANLGIVTDRPKNQHYAIESQRLSSFQGWPPYKHQTPQLLAEAGFWYAGFNDNVKCFYCDGGLRNWEPGDEPWEEHARWFPKCPFVIQVKGQEFINNVLKEKGLEPPAIIQDQTATQANRGQSAGKYRIEEREIRARMDSPNIRKVLELGFSREIVMNTLRKRLRETGDDFPSITTLMEAIYKEEAEEANNQPQNPPQSNNNTQSQNATQSQNFSQSSAVTRSQNVTGQTGSNDIVEDTPGVTSTSVNQSENNTDKGKQEAGTSKKKSEVKGAGKNDTADDMSNLSSPKIHAQADDLMKENLELKEQRLCKICMVTDANVVFLPCGHLVSCATCAPALQQCPICRASIKGTVRTYIA